MEIIFAYIFSKLSAAFLFLMCERVKHKTSKYGIGLTRISGFSKVGDKERSRSAWTSEQDLSCSLSSISNFL